jgi:repressor LexA
MPEPLSPLERRVYHYLLDFLAENTYQPSVRDIARKFRIRSTKTVAYLLQSLAEKGYIEREGSRSRGVRIVGYSSIGHTQPVAFLEDVAALDSVPATEGARRFIAMDRTFVPSDDAFFVRVGDDAMMPRGICAGDLVLVDPSARARDGDLIAVRVGRDVVVRMMGHRGAKVALVTGSTSTGETVLGPNDDFAVLGLVATVVRSVLPPQEDEEAVTELTAD